MKKDFDSAIDRKAANEIVKKELYREARLAFAFEPNSPEEENGVLDLLDKLVFRAIQVHAGHYFGRMGRLVDQFDGSTFESIERYVI